MNKREWLYPDIKGLHCPLCNRILVHEKYFELESDKQSIYTSYTFMLMLKCENCNYPISISGTHEELLTENYELEHTCEIKSMYPAVRIIPLHVEYPEIIRRELTKSFSLYWVDASSCANKLRVVIELFLDEQNVEKSSHLHNRISKHPNANISGLLESVKWIGNFGSHGNEITKKQILDAYEFLDKVLDLAYVHSEKKLMLKSKNINKNKKPN